METLNFASAVKKIYESKFYFFSNKTLQDCIEVKNANTFFKYVKKLVNENILVKVERGKYLLKNAKFSDFELANFLVTPSYVSFESALNFYGILSQFPYEITSVTPKKTRIKKYNKTVFSYHHFDKELFFGYQKVDNFLIALPEKALLDEIYLTAKGLKSIDFKELDLKKIKKNLIKEFLNKYPKTKQFISLINKLKDMKIL
ncbi:MAG: type IV toxin-antitoxin system AbiEi family antitoxin domain-containing protein [Microgenomates group bacterium]